MTAVGNFYQHAMYSVFSSKREVMDWKYLVSATLGTLMLESHSVLKIGSDCFLTAVDLQNFGVNPREITKEQSLLKPLLLLHGRAHNQGVWLTFAKFIQKSGIKNPVYSIPLTDSIDVTEKDIYLVEMAFAEIKRQYKAHLVEDVKIHLLGYSRGALVAYHFLSRLFLQPRNDIGKVIMLGASPMSQLALNFFSNFELQVYRISAQFELLLPSMVPVIYRNKEIFISTGHLGLPLSPECHQKVVELITT